MAGARDAERRRAAVADLYDRHVGDVYRFVYRRCRDGATAEDVTQDTFLAVLATVDDPADIGIGWLIRVARNRLLNIADRSGRYEAKLRLVHSRDETPDHDTIVVNRLRVETALEQLDVDHRLVLMLHYVDGHTIASLAEEMGRSPNAVEKLVTRARRNFRREMERADA